MTRQREAYFVTGQDVVNVATELNGILTRIADRLDRIEGLRGNPRFYSTTMEYDDSIAGVLTAQTANTAEFGTTSVEDGGTGSDSASGARAALGLGTISTQDADNVTISGGTVKILDASETVIHQFPIGLMAQSSEWMGFH